MPCTFALHCAVAPAASVVGLHVTATLVIEDAGAAGASTVIVADAVLLASCTLVAVTVRLPADAGAVTSPLAVTEPPLTLHATAEL